MKFPDTIFRNISGKFLDKDYNPVSKADVITLLESKDKFVVKPSIDNGVGKGVMLIKHGDNIVKILSDFGTDYIIQEVFEQHPTIARFNPSSVNVIRYISLYYNREVIPVMAALRCGAEGAFTDNSIDSDGKGMFVIGIDDNGRLKDIGYHSCGLSLKDCPNGEKFAGVQIPGFDKITQTVKEAHKRLVHFGFVAWDFAVGKDGEPCCMEYNIKGPGVLYYQYVNGPLFGQYTKDVLEYCKNKNK